MLPDKPSNEMKAMQDHLLFLAEIANASTLDPKSIHDSNAFPIGEHFTVTHELYHSVVEVFRDVPMQTACYGSLPVLELPANPHPARNVPVEEQLPTESGRPLLSYVDMIKEALIRKSDHCMKLQDIYESIKERYPYFQTSQLAWKVLPI